MRCILVPLDGTAFGEAALPLATRLAGRTNAELVLAHVRELPVAVTGLEGVLPADPTATDALDRTYLDGVATRCMDLLRDVERGVRTLLLDGSRAHAIHEAAREIEADLIVMSSHGRHGLSRLLLGSTAESVVRAGGVPVLVVPTRETRLSAAAATPALSHVVIPLDESPESEMVLAPALTLARLVASTVTLVTVRDSGDRTKATLLPTAILDTERSEAQPDAYLATLARRLTDAGYAIATRAFEGHPVVDRLLDAIGELGADWLAMATHGRGFWARLVAGSVAEQLLERVEIPVLLVRPDPGTST